MSDREFDTILERDSGERHVVVSYIVERDESSGRKGVYLDTIRDLSGATVETTDAENEALSDEAAKHYAKY